jgi:hypothetical protein
MLKDTMSRTAFVAVLLVSAPALADDSALAQMVNSLSQQVQDQQKEINQLLKEKRTAKKSETQQPLLDAAEVARQKPGVVAPLQPTSLGTLRVTELNNPQPVTTQDLGAVSQAPASAVQIGTAYQAPLSKTLSAPVYRPRQAQPAPAVSQPQTVSAMPQQQFVPAAALSSQPQTVQVASAAPVVTNPAIPNTNASPTQVGQAPPSSTKPPELQPLANIGGVLTPYGKAVVEPFLQYARSSVNTFAFEGVEVVPAFLIGTVAANRTADDLLTSGATVRMGLSDRLEAEIKVPFVYRSESFTNTIPNAQNQITTTNANGYGLGDVEAAAHYQINDGREDWPFFIGNMRFKSDTGTSPYNVAYNADGSARKLATGSGFMAVEPSVTAIYPSDPATLFANLGYIHSFDENINHTVAGSAIGNVSPGDTYIASLGMGVALNDKLSFILGYEHDYVRPTSTVVGGVTQNSQPLQIGSALSGVTYKLNNRTSINLNMAAGVTADAPNVVIGLRVPVTLQVF